MASAIYSASVRWEGEEIEKYFSHDWPVKIDENQRKELVSRTIKLEEIEQDISIASLRYFWCYERQLWLDASDTNLDCTERKKAENRKRVIINDVTNPIEFARTGFDHYAQKRDHHTSNITFPFHRVPRDDELKVPVEFEKESNYISHYVTAINALHKLCFTCLHTNKEQLDGLSDHIRYLFDVLSAAEECLSKFMAMEISAARSIYQDVQKTEIYCNAFYGIRPPTDLYAGGGEIARELESFPLFDSFINFQKVYGRSFEKVYGGELKFNNPVRRYTHHYWHQPKCHQELITTFINFLGVTTDNSDCTEAAFFKFVSDFKTDTIHFINALINRYLKVCTTEFDLANHLLILNTQHWPDALFAKLITELHGNKKYATCVICHQAFPIDAPHNQMYCPDCIPRARSYQMRMKKIRDRLLATNQADDQKN